MEKRKHSFLMMLSVLIAVLTAICFYDNFSGISNTIYELGIVVLLFYVKKSKLRQKCTIWDYLYGITLGLLSLVPTVSSNGGMIFLELILYSAIIIKWAIHIAYGIEQIPVYRHILIYFEMLEKSITELFAPMKEKEERKYYQQRNQFWGQKSDFITALAEQGRQNLPLTKQQMGQTAEQGQQEFVQSGEQNESKDNDKSNMKSQIFHGIVVALPILFFVLLLLSSSDAMFRKIITSVMIIPDSIDDVIAIVFLMFMGFIISYGIGRTLILHKANINVVQRARTNAVTGITFTAIFAGVYILFVIVQIIGLLNTSGSMLPENYTYAKYAREGFFQLLVVCMINVIMVIGCRIRFEERGALQKLLYVISGCTYFMIFSSIYRMVLYIRAYDLTVLRLFALYGLLTIFCIMCVVLVFIKNEKIKLCEYIVVIVGIGFAIFALARPDYIVAKYNINYLNEKEIDYEYLRGLSNDATGVIVDSGITEQLDDRYDDEYENRGDETYYTQHIVRMYEDDIKGDIRKFNISDFIAYNAAKNYEENRGELEI